MPQRRADPHLEASTNRWMVGGVVLMALLVLAFPAYRLYEPGARAATRDAHQASLVEQGGRLFEIQCTGCHGLQGRGGSAPALNSQQFLTGASDAQISSLIAVGIPGSPMAAYSLDHGGPLTSEQIESLAVFLRSLEADAPDNPDWRTPQP
ncbi:MAG: cytochrome c [Actinobacteria bacterium]|nr:cytochrome c [Actinomycetota bacterium]